MTALILVNTIKVQELYLAIFTNILSLFERVFGGNYLRLCGIYDFHGYLCCGAVYRHADWVWSGKCN